MRNGFRLAAALVSVMAVGITTTYNVKAENILKMVSAGDGKYSATVYDKGTDIAVETAGAMTPVDNSTAEGVSVGAGADIMTVVDDAVTVSFETAVQTVSGEVTPAEDGAEPEDELANLCVANVDNSMNVRTEPSEEASLAGYLYKDCVSELLEQKDGWTHIKSGNLEGWAKDDFLVFGSEARERIESTNRKVATINTETLRVRSDADENSSITALLGEGMEVDVVNAEDDWTKISFDDGTEGSEEGYVSSEFISIGYDFIRGETVAEAEIREEKAKAEKEAAAKASEKAKKDSEKSKEQKVKDSVAAAAANDNAAQTTATNVTNNGAAAADVDDETLLAALIQCECGNDIYEGKLAVGAVVINRARGSYGSIKNAIYAPYQFGPASSGKLALTLATGAISATSRQAAADAISGVSNIGYATHFRNAKSGHAGIVVGNHVFW